MTMIESFGYWLIAAPIWQVALAIFGGMFMAIVMGSLFRRFHRPDYSNDPKGAETDSSEQAVMASAVMGLLALLIGFTFSLAISRFDTKRQNVLLEANAIGTTYLRTQMLGEPHRSRLSKLLVDYTNARLALAVEQPGPRQFALIKVSDGLIVDLWKATVAAFPAMHPDAFSNSYLEAMNNLIDMDAVRKTGRQAHIPPEVLLVLFLYQFTAAAVIAYVLVGKSSRQTSVLLFVLFGISLFLVVDLDRATSGGITESQQPMLDLRAFLRDAPPATFNLPVPPAAPQPK